MPRISAQRQQDRHDAILEAGQQVLAARGYAGASIAAIARAAGVSDGLVYRYFANKRELLIAVLAGFYNRVIDGLEAMIDREAGFRARIRAIVRAHVQLFALDGEMCRLFLTEVRVAADYLDTPIFRLNQRYTSIVLKVAADGKAEGALGMAADPRVLRDMLFGGIEHFAWRHLQHPGQVDLDAGAERIADTLLDGVCGAQAA